VAEAKAEPHAGPEKAAPKRKPPKRKRVEETARHYFAAVAARDPDAMSACWSPEGVEDLVPLRVLRGPAENRKFFRAMFSAVPDIETTVHNVVADDRRAAVEWRMVGTFSGTPFEGVEATGGRIELRGFDLLEIEDDRITKNTAYWDGAAFLRQLGMLPAQESGAERTMKTAFNTLTRVRRQVARRRAAG
jgi:steroid delta-isomerase-like uncharacterized protein